MLEADPGRRLSYTWHTFTPAWARAHDLDDSVSFEMIQDGWPALVSSLKSLLETGEPLPE